MPPHRAFRRKRVNTVSACLLSEQQSLQNVIAPHTAQPCTTEYAGAVEQVWELRQAPGSGFERRIGEMRSTDLLLQLLQSTGC